MKDYYKIYKNIYITELYNGSYILTTHEWFSSEDEEEVQYE